MYEWKFFIYPESAVKKGFKKSIEPQPSKCQALLLKDKASQSLMEDDMTEKEVKKEKISRQPMPEQKPEIRRRNFEEVPMGYTPELARQEAERCLQCKKPACMEGCPVSVDIPAFINLVKDGEFTKAIRKIWERNALPAVCGRVCPQEIQCEGNCIVGKKDQPVAIGNLERFVADWERANG